MTTRPNIEMFPKARIPYGTWGSSYFPAWQTSALAEVNIGQFAGEAMNRILGLRKIPKSELEYLIIGTKLFGFVGSKHFPPSIRRLEIVDDDERISEGCHRIGVWSLESLLSNDGSAKGLECVRILTSTASFYNHWVILANKGRKDVWVEVVMMSRTPLEKGIHTVTIRRAK